MLILEFMIDQRPRADIADALIQVTEGSQYSPKMYYIPVDHWSRKQYVQHWLAALDQLESNGKSAFLLLADEVNEDSSFECFMAWKSDDGYVFQHDWIVQDDYEEPINLDIPWLKIEDIPSSEIMTVNIPKKDLATLKESLIKSLNELD
jgi:hypothetical protein